MGIICQVCDRELKDFEDEWLFCPYCGADLATTAPSRLFQVNQNVDTVEKGASFVGVKIGRLG